MKRFQFHPIAGIMPMIEGAEFQELVADIKEHGLLVPIVLFEGMILDGRNRYLACIEAGVKPKFVKFKGKDPIDWMLSINAKRRHLKDIHRAEMVIKEQEIRNSRKDGTQATNAEILKKHNISERTVKRVKAILKSGNETLIDAVRKEEIGIRTAHDIVKGVSADTPLEEKNAEINAEPPKAEKQVSSIYNEDFQIAFGITDEMFFEELVVIIRKKMEFEGADVMEIFSEILAIGGICNKNYNQMAGLIKTTIFCRDFGKGYDSKMCLPECGKIRNAMCNIWKNRLEEGVPYGTEVNKENAEIEPETLELPLDIDEELKSENGILKGVDLKPVIEVERISRDMVTLEQPKVVLQKPGAANRWEKPKTDKFDLIDEYIKKIPELI